MRIISPFHDYYDSIQATGQDQTLVYHRIPTVGKYLVLPVCTAALLCRFYRFKDFTVRDNVVGFCGKIYGVLELRSPKTGTFVHDLDGVDKFVATNFSEEQINAYHSSKRSYSRKWLPEQRRVAFVNFFDEVTQKQNNFARAFVENNAPTFVCAKWQENEIVYNARLADVEFFRVFDPFRAFMEIASFLGGLARPEKGPPPIPDEILAQAKGFDRFSFRKPPTKKR